MLAVHVVYINEKRILNILTYENCDLKSKCIAYYILKVYNM